MEIYAIIESGGKQHQVKLGSVIEVEKLDKPGKIVTFQQVLLLAQGDKIQVGQPILEGVTVKAEVIEEAVKGDKLRIFRYKAKSRYRKTQGHRQTHTTLKVVEIAGKKLSAAKPKAKAKPVAKKTAAKKSAPTKKALVKKTPAKKATTTKKAPTKKASSKKPASK